MRGLRRREVPSQQRQHLPRLLRREVCGLGRSAELRALPGGPIPGVDRLRGLRRLRCGHVGGRALRADGVRGRAYVFADRRPDAVERAGGVAHGCAHPRPHTTACTPGGRGHRVRGRRGQLRGRRADGAHLRRRMPGGLRLRVGRNLLLLRRRHLRLGLRRRRHLRPARTAPRARPAQPTTPPVPSRAATARMARSPLSAAPCARTALFWASTTRPPAARAGLPRPASSLVWALPQWQVPVYRGIPRV